MNGTNQDNSILALPGDQLLAAIVANSDDAIISKDLNGTIMSWNRAAERIFGYSPPEVLGRSITIIIPADRRQEENNILARLRAGERIDFETVRVTKDGRLLNISLTISPIRDNNGVIIGASKIARDITPQKAVEAALRLAHEQLRSHADRLETRAAEGLLHQSIANLVSNAVKFVARGVRPAVRIWTEPRGDQVRLVVQDNGIGIPGPDRDRIFQVFTRGDQARGYEGTGVGLAVVQRAVTRMGGTTGVESELGKGSRFWIQLKAAPN